MLEHALENAISGREIHTFEKQFKIKYFLIRQFSFDTYSYKSIHMEYRTGEAGAKRILAFHSAKTIPVSSHSDAPWSYIGQLVTVCTFENLQSQFLLFHSEVVNISALRD